MLNIDAPAGVVAELERQTAINEDIIRYMTIKVDEPETGPSAMMRKSERGERLSRGDGEGRGRDGEGRRNREDGEYGETSPWQAPFSAAVRAAASPPSMRRRSLPQKSHSARG